VKLLFDEMLAPSLVHRLSDLFQDSEHVRNLGLKKTPDTDVWYRAKELGYTLVTKDKDFANLSAVWPAPPKVILLQLGNCSVQDVENRLRRDAVRIGEFIAHSPKTLLVITP
jgi:predicted nuclease of predicted toxin-antitoxin system